MNIEIKDLVISGVLSENSTAFRGVIWIDNFPAAVATNWGRGARTFIDPIDERGIGLIVQADKFIETLPPIAIQLQADAAEKTTQYRLDLSSYVDQLVQKHQEQKLIAAHNNRVMRAAERGIVFGVPDVSYKTRTFSVPISQVANLTRGHQVLVAIIKSKVLPNMAKDEKILNTNLPAEVIDQIGADKFHLPAVQNFQSLDRQQNRGIKR